MQLGPQQSFRSHWRII